MKLLVPIPESWTREARPEGLVAVEPGGAWRVLVTPLVGAHPEPRSWMIRHIAVDAPFESAQTKTAQGWPVLLLETVRDGELRVAAYVRVLDLGAAIVARGPLGGAWREQALALVDAACPDLTQPGFACLADQLDGLVELLSAPPEVDA